MVTDPNEPAIVNPTMVDTTNTLEDTVGEVEDNEDLLADLGDLDKAISISFTIEDKGRGLPILSEPEI